MGDNLPLAGPPDAPLDVQLEMGPSPGIVLLSWLPVTIDAAGTSNGVPVTGYTVYADRKKVRPPTSSPPHFLSRIILWVQLTNKRKIHLWLTDILKLS